jgi:hypothetical protein
MAESTHFPPPRPPAAETTGERHPHEMIASPTGAARMPTHGSWQPLVTISVSSKARVIVRCGDMIETKLRETFKGLSLSTR